MLGKAQQSRKLWLAALACAAGLNALACGGGSDDDNQQNINPGGDAGQMGNPMPTGDGGTSNPQPTNDAGTSNPQPTNDAGTTQPVADAGPVDIGQDSKGDTFLRADTLRLEAPHMYWTVLFITSDVTQNGQDELNKTLTTDGNADGFVDLSMLLRFVKTKTPAVGSGMVTPGGALCPMPLGPTGTCGPDKTFPFQTPALKYANDAQPCAVTGTQEKAPAPCFATEPASLTMQLPILGAVPLQEGQIVGTWDNGNIRNGFVRGFLSSEVAAATKLGEGVPKDLALVGIMSGVPLTSFLSQKEKGMNSAGQEGWWFLMTYTAKAASFDPAAKVP